MSDEQYRDGTFNMYHCRKCPKCQSEYRWPNQSGVVLCDDCGHNEPVSATSVDRDYMADILRYTEDKPNV